MIDVGSSELMARAVLEGLAHYKGEDRRHTLVSLGQLEDVLKEQLVVIGALRAAQKVADAAEVALANAEHYGAVLTISRDYFRPLEKALEEYDAYY